MASLKEKWNTIALAATMAMSGHGAANAAETAFTEKKTDQTEVVDKYASEDDKKIIAFNQRYREAKANISEPWAQAYVEHYDMIHEMIFENSVTDQAKFIFSEKNTPEMTDQERMEEKQNYVQTQYAQYNPAKLEMQTNVHESKFEREFVERMEKYEQRENLRTSLKEQQGETFYNPTAVVSNMRLDMHMKRHQKEAEQHRESAAKPTRTVKLNASAFAKMGDGR